MFRTLSTRKNHIEYTCLGLTSGGDQGQYKNLKFLVQEEAEASEEKLKTLEPFPQRRTQQQAGDTGQDGLGHLLLSGAQGALQGGGTVQAAPDSPVWGLP